MRRSAIGLVTLAVYATGLVIPMVTASGAEAGHRQPHKYQKRVNQRLKDAWASQGVRPLAPPPVRGNVCPGSGRAIDCAVWPPPFDDDPDRKATSSDGG